MANKKGTVRIIGLKSHNKAIKLLTKDLSFETAKEVDNIYDKMIVDMKSIISPWKFTSGKGGVFDSFIKTQLSKDTKGYRLSLSNTAPHASALIKGVKDHWTRKGRSTKLDKWMKDKDVKWTTAKDGNLIVRLGNPSVSNIMARNSNRDFWTPVLKKYEKDLLKLNIGIKDALNNFERRAGKRDTIILR